MLQTQLKILQKKNKNNRIYLFSGGYYTIELANRRLRLVGLNMNLYLYNTDGKLIRQLTKNKWVAKKILGSDARGKSIFFTGTGSNPTETHVFKVSTGGRQTQLTKMVTLPSCNCL